MISSFPITEELEPRNYSKLKIKNAGLYLVRNGFHRFYDSETRSCPTETRVSFWSDESTFGPNLTYVCFVPKFSTIMNITVSKLLEIS